MRPIVQGLSRAFWFVLAAIFLLEAWLWDLLHPMIAALVRALPFERLKAAIARAVSSLPPWATLAVFIIPAMVILPFKLVAVWLIARGHFVLGALTFVAAKMAGVAVTAFLFEVCKPKLLQMPWFVRFYQWMLALKDWAHRKIEPARLAIARWRVSLFGDGRGFTARLAILRQRVRAGAFRQPG